MNARRSTLSLLAVALISMGCVSLDYDLANIPVDVSAKPASPDSEVVESFTIEAKNVLWIHGLFGHEQPDVASLLSQKATDGVRIANFRVRQTSNIHQWLLTHLTLTLVRMRTVVIEGDVVRDAG